MSVCISYGHGTFVLYPQTSQGKV